MRVTGKTRERKFFLFPLVFLLLGNKYAGNSYVEGSYSFFLFFFFFKAMEIFIKHKQTASGNISS